MPTERMQRQIDRLLDEAETAASERNWAYVADCARKVLAVDAGNEDAAGFLSMAEGQDGAPRQETQKRSTPSSDAPSAAPPLPASFAGGRYAVRRFLGEGGRKRVYLAHDERLKRDVAVAVIKTDGLDAQGLSRVHREAQAMAKLGDHPHIVTIHDVGDDNGQPYIVSQFMSGGAVDALEQPIALERTLEIAKGVCRGLAHAHRHGIVHRDLKPGNVWLAADGTAGIGDFGLAVAFEQSRLTMRGMLVGTVAYMPPEQALGSETTPRADLYSLGCMLYEMITGRRPFVSDNPTAVISQHINTPPVAPSWLSDACPQDLEELVLRLLAKDPSERPANADEVLAALERVDPAQRSASHSDSNVLDRLAMGVFVGREHELERLRKACDNAIAGHGGLVMLVGEPGIGKTRTTQELETYARMRGAQVLWGRTHESAGAPPYWPWLQAGNQYAAAHVDDLTTLIGPQITPEAISELTRIFPWLLQGPNAPAPPESVDDPEVAQFRLFDAYAQYLRAIAVQAPLIIALDDLHWADKPTLQMLQHIARELSRMRVLVVANYRDTDITRQSALSETLASLNRESGFDRIVLRGLSRDEVAAYIKARANVEPRREVLDRIFEETEGNAFFLSEVVNLMAQEGSLTKTSISDIAIPDGVREALGRRLNRLTEETNELLQVAAIIGRDFTYDTLTLLGDRDDDALLKMIEEALEARVIEETEQAGRYRFTHAQMQETLLAELSTTRRVRLHGQVGEALEKRYGAHAEERAGRLAMHFGEAAMLSPRHARKAGRYGKLAAQQAEAQSAWGEAARHYERCLALVSEAEDHLGEDEAALLVSYGHCLRASADIRGAWRSVMRAVSLYRDRGDGLALARALLEVDGIYVEASRIMPLVEEAIVGGGTEDPYVRARLLVWRATTPDIEEARAIADRHAFKDVEARLLVRDAMVASTGEHSQTRAVELFTRAHDALVESGQSLLAARVYDGGLLNAVVLLGRSGDIEAAASRALEEARRMGERRVESNALFWLATVAALRCDFELCDALLAQADDDYFWVQLLRVGLAELRGDSRRAVGLMPDERSAGTFPQFVVQLKATRARVRLNAGDEAAARVEIDAFFDYARTNHIRWDSPAGFGGVWTFGERIVDHADDATVRWIYDYHTSFPDMRLTFDAGSADLLSGHLALRLGLVDEAEQHFRVGLAWCEQEHWPVEQARCLEGLARVAEHRGDIAEERQLLDQAISIFKQHGAKLYLDRVIARKLELHGISTITDIYTSIDAVADSVGEERPDIVAHAAPDGTVTIMFSDIEDSTVLTERLGDQAWQELLRKHNALIREQLRAHDGYEVKTMGDGFMVAFQSAKKGLDCAIAMQKAFAENESMLDAGNWKPEGDASSLQIPASSVKIRIGLHAGEMIKDGDDFYGRNVIVASRVAGKAAGGEILVSSLLRQLVESSVGSGTFGAPREVELKGLSGTHTVYAAGAAP
jgi:class 3 adenylate cyclase/Cdc6-like AAA superfamily ATPase